MSSNLSSGSLKLLSIQTVRAFPPFLCTLPHKSCRWWNSQGWPERFAPSAGSGILAHPLQTLLTAVFSHITIPRAQDPVGEGCVSNVDPHYIQSNVLLKDWGTQKGSPTTVFHFNTRAQLLVAFVPNCWPTGLYVFWATPTRKRIRSLLLKSIESKDFTLLHQHGLCFVEPKYQLRG